MKKLLFVLGLCIIVMSSFVSADLNEGLVAWWTMDETSGNAADASGQINDFIEQGTVASAGGKIGNARGGLITDTNYLNMSDSEFSAHPSAPFTIVYWHYNVTTGNIARLFEISGTTTNAYFIMQYRGGGGICTVNGGLTGSQESGCDLDSSVNGSWHQDVISCPTNNPCTWYKDGAVQATVNRGGNDGNPAKIWYIGRSIATGQSNIYILVDEVAFYNRTFNTTDVADVWNSGQGVTYSDFGNTAPNTPSPTLVSVDGTNNTNADLNCSATITDDDGDSMNVTVEWFNNSVSMGYYNLNNNYANGTEVSHIFDSGNFTIDNIGDDIICSMQATDGSDTSDWGNSTNLTLLEAYNTEPSNIKSYISYNVNGELQYDENNETNPVAANSWALNFTGDIYSNYSDSLNLVVCNNIADNESDCNVLCSSPSVVNGSVGCLYAPGTTGGFSRTAYAYTNGSWSNYTTIPYYVSSKGGDIPTTYNSSLPFFINTSVSDTITNPYTASCTSGSTCSYNYTVQVTETAGIGNYTLFAYDSKGLASFNNETFEVLGGTGYGTWTWTNVSVDENVVDRNEMFVVTVTAYCKGPYACDYRSGAIHLDP